MSFRQDFLKARLSKLPAHAPPFGNGNGNGNNDDDDDDDNEQEELDDFDVNGSMPSTSSGFMKPRLPGQARLGSSSTSSQDYSPVSGKDYFAQALAVNVNQDPSQTTTRPTDSPPSSSSNGDNGVTGTLQQHQGSEPIAGSSNSSSFRVYYTPPAVSDQAHGTEDDDDDADNPVVFVCHHGAGYSAMSFALLAKELVSAGQGVAGLLALDCRGHGKTVCRDENLEIETLANDLVEVLKEVYPSRTTCPDLVLVGHSMGGSVVVHACARVQAEVGNVVGVCNLDVVEGTAMDALAGMMDIVSARPKGFPSQEEAIAWHVQSKTIGSLQSARISVPPLFVEDTAERDDSLRFKWRTDLAASQPYWEGWFKQLSSSFLSQRCAKLLVLAGAESLDKDLMIGQMQGRYQLSVFQDVGHCLQEEAPLRLAHLLLEFWKRNSVARDQAKILKNVKKVGQA